MICQIEITEREYLSKGSVTLFMFAFLEPVQIYSSAEAAQIKPIEKPVYRSRRSVTLFNLCYWIWSDLFVSRCQPTEAD